VNLNRLLFAAIGLNVTTVAVINALFDVSFGLHEKVTSSDNLPCQQLFADAVFRLIITLGLHR